MNMTRKIPRYLSEEEIQRLKAVPYEEENAWRKELREKRKAGGKFFKRLRNKIFNAKRDFAILALFYSSGIRLSELAALNIDDIDLEGAVVRVLGKGGKEREATLTHEAIKMVRSYLKARAFWKGHNDPALFLTRTGARIKKRDIERKIEEYGKKAGIKKHITPHMLRHSIATHLLNSGMDIRRVQAFLGHTSLASTQIYTWIINDKQKEEIRNHHPDYKGKKV